MHGLLKGVRRGRVTREEERASEKGLADEGEVAIAPRPDDKSRTVR